MPRYTKKKSKSKKPQKKNSSKAKLKSFMSAITARNEEE